MLSQVAEIHIALKSVEMRLTLRLHDLNLLTRRLEPESAWTTVLQLKHFTRLRETAEPVMMQENFQNVFVCPSFWEQSELPRIQRALVFSLPGLVTKI